MRQVKIDPKKKDIIKRFKMSREEEDTIKNLQFIVGLLQAQIDGIKELMYKAVRLIRIRLDVHEKDAPAGYERFTDIDPSTWEFVVIDRPVLKEGQNGGKGTNGEQIAKN